MQRHRVFVTFLSLYYCLSLRLMLVCANGQPQSSSSLYRRWYRGTATWYGEPEGSGSTGGACGYGTMVNVKPYKQRVSAGGPLLFKKGKGCGACYKVKCREKSICAKRAVTVIITDECPGCPSNHFDLSGAAFGRMAVKGKNGLLRNKGRLPIVYKRISCKYPGKQISYHVNEGSSPYWLSLLVEYVKDAGEIGAMHIQQAGSKVWIPMTHMWGANWAITKGPLKGPFSVRLTSSIGKNFTAINVIPSNFSPKTTYTSSSHGPKGVVNKHLSPS